MFISYKFLHSLYLFLDSKIHPRYINLAINKTKLRYLILYNFVAFFSNFYEFKKEDANNFLYDNELFFLNNIILKNCKLSILELESILFNSSNHYKFSLESLFKNNFFLNEKNRTNLNDSLISKLSIVEFVKQKKIFFLTRKIISKSNDNDFLTKIYYLYLPHIKHNRQNPILDDEERLLIISIISNKNTSFSLLHQIDKDFPAYTKILKKHPNFNKTAKAITDLILS